MYVVDKAARMATGTRDYMMIIVMRTKSECVPVGTFSEPTVTNVYHINRQQSLDA